MRPKRSNNAPVRRLLPLLLLAILACGTLYFFVTTRYVGRHMLEGVSEPDAFEGPDLVGGFILYRSMRGPECYIEAPNAKRIMPPADSSGHSAWTISAIGVQGGYILGQLTSLGTGAAGGFFMIDTASGEVRGPMDEAAWRATFEALQHQPPPALEPAETYGGP